MPLCDGVGSSGFDSNRRIDIASQANLNDGMAVYCSVRILHISNWSIFAIENW